MLQTCNVLTYYHTHIIPPTTTSIITHILTYIVLWWCVLYIVLINQVVGGLQCECCSRMMWLVSCAVWLCWWHTHCVTVSLCHCVMIMHFCVVWCCDVVMLWRFVCVCVWVCVCVCLCLCVCVYYRVINDVDKTSVLLEKRVEQRGSWVACTAVSARPAPTNAHKTKKQRTKNNVKIKAGTHTHRTPPNTHTHTHTHTHTNTHSIV